MKYNALADKVFVLGIDGLDPSLVRKYVNMGIMPNTKKYIELGSARADLAMLGGHPTVTPPMWTTLGTGCYANVHGISGYNMPSEKDLDIVEYSMDSRKCKAEQMWNVTAEAGKKTLVWHWPGGAWPPTSDNENLYVVDGSAPGGVGNGYGFMEDNYLVGASETFSEVKYVPKAASNSSAACVMTGLELEETEEKGLSKESMKGQDIKILLMDESYTCTAYTEVPLDLVQSPLKPASGWINAPKEAKEFTLLASKGLIHRNCLLLKNADGIYDSVAIYKSKKSDVPIATLPLGELVTDIVDDVVRNGEKISAVRAYKLLKCDPEGSSLTMYVSAAMKQDCDAIFHPKELYQKLVDNIGYLPPTANVGCQDSMFIHDIDLHCWDYAVDWNAKSILYLIETEGIEVIFSHFHSIDLQSHLFIKHMADRPFNRQPVEVAEGWMQDIYKQADNYVGKFLHLLDEGWTILIVSDHGQVSAKHDVPLLGDIAGINVGVMRELGYTVMKKDENGNDIPEIDWTKTKAVAQRESNIYINLIGRTDHGIVDPADKYELEEQIMTDLYGYRDKKTGHRVVAVALRNKDAVLLGYGGPTCGDICYWLAEGYNFDHADCLSTTCGESDTSVAPTFIAAGKGIKKGFTTERYIREVDVVPTVAVLTGVRMPAQCEGAPVYQILEETV